MFQKCVNDEPLLNESLFSERGKRVPGSIKQHIVSVSSLRFLMSGVGLRIPKEQKNISVDILDFYSNFASDSIRRTPGMSALPSHSKGMSSAALKLGLSPINLGRALTTNRKNKKLNSDLSERKLKVVGRMKQKSRSARTRVFFAGDVPRLVYTKSEPAINASVTGTLYLSQPKRSIELKHCSGESSRFRKVL